MQNPLSNDLSFYKQLFERSHTVKLIIDPATVQIVEANPAACTFYGYTHEQLTAMRLTDININTMSEHSIHEVIQRIINNQETILQTQHRLASGKVCDVEVFVCSVERDTLTYLYAIVTDITVQEEAKKALLQSENIYRLFAQNMPDSSVVMFDTQMRYTLVEGPFLKRFGTVAENMVGRLPHEILETQAAVDFIVPIYQRALNGESFSYERQTPDYAYEAHVAPLRDENDQIIGGMILSRNITERKRLENELRASEERLRLITDSIPDLITQSDADSRITYANPAARTILGIEPEALVGQLREGFIHPDDSQHLRGVYTKSIESGAERMTSEVRLRHADGRYIPVETAARLLYNHDGSYTGGIYVARDITERKKLYNLQLEKEKLETALTKEQELSSLKTRMMERIAHEFRTPLAVIQASMETLMAYFGRLTPAQRDRRADTVRSQILRITDMLDEIGLVVTGTFTPESINRYPTDISMICRDLAIYLAGYFNLPDKYVLHIPQTTVVSVDARLIRIALLHIMRNAARFSEPSAVVTVDLSPGENSIEIRVSDSGIGILPEELPRIFDPFFRGSNISERGGLGLGLTIAHAAIEAHGGKVTIESDVGNGTTVKIWLPV